MSDNKATQKLERVYSEVIGLVSLSSISGNRYAISSIDESSGREIQNASIANFQRVYCTVRPTKILRTDNGKGYKKKHFKSFCISNEISPEITIPETPEQSGVAECFNRTVVKAARCLLMIQNCQKTIGLELRSGHLKCLVV